MDREISIAAVTEHPTALPRSGAAGRLIRLRKQGDAHGIAYIVAVTDAAEAMELVRVKVAGTSDTIEDCGRVSDELLKALQLSPGAITRADDLHSPWEREYRLPHLRNLAAAGCSENPRVGWREKTA
jgi:hypothetical protein